MILTCRHLASKKTRWRKSLVLRLQVIVMKVCVISNVTVGMKLVAKNVKPRWWMDDFRICYNLLNEVFDCASRCEGSQEKTSRAALLTLDASLTLPSYMKNLKRTARNNVLKKPHTVVTELYKENQEFVGPECERNGITRSVLNDILKENSEESSVDSKRSMHIDSRKKCTQSYFKKQISIRVRSI